MNKQKTIQKLFKITDNKESIGDTITEMASLLEKTKNKTLKEDLALLFLYKNSIQILDRSITNTGGQIDFGKDGSQSAMIVEHISNLTKTRNCIAAWGKNLHEKIMYIAPKKIKLPKEKAAPKKVEKKVAKKKGGGK